MISALALAALLCADKPISVPVVSSVDALLAKVSAEHPGPMVVHFWATWCGACVREMPEIRKLAKGLREAGITFVGVSMDPKERVLDVAKFAQRERLDFPQFLLDAPDPAPVVSRFDPNWQAELPATFLLLQSGRPTGSFLGPTPVERVLEGAKSKLGPPVDGP